MTWLWLIDENQYQIQLLELLELHDNPSLNLIPVFFMAFSMAITIL